MIDKLTLSICPACYDVIPAIITTSENGVFITKECRKHGCFQGMVERDPRWYNFCRNENQQKIYDGYFIDVTDKCNLSCQYCFHPKGDNARTVQDIVADAKENAALAPFLLTGGEPTLHPDLPEIVRELSAIGETWVLSNGVKLCDEAYLDELCKAGLLHEKTLYVGLSYHREAKGRDIDFLILCREKGLKVGSVQYVIDNISQIDEAITLYENYRDVITIMKIKAASNLWQEHDVRNTIFTSDMINYLRTKGEVDLIPGMAQKVSYASVMFKRCLPINLVSWYEVGNVDLYDIDCPPYYRSKDGVIRDFVTACLFNDWMDAEIEGVRVRRAVENDINEIGRLWMEFVMEEDEENTPNLAAWIKQTQAIINHKDHYLLIAEKGGKIIGFQSGDVALQPAINKICVFGRHFYVQPEHRKGPAARMLNDLTIRFGRKAGVTDILRPIKPKLLDFWKAKGCKIQNIIVRTGYVGG